MRIEIFQKETGVSDLVINSHIVGIDLAKPEAFLTAYLARKLSLTNA